MLLSLIENNLSSTSQMSCGAELERPVKNTQRGAGEYLESITA
jgi:hypothetical protein